MKNHSKLLEHVCAPTPVERYCFTNEYCLLSNYKLNRILFIKNYGLLKGKYYPLSNFCSMFQGVDNFEKK